ncbi:odorant receptor 13a-like [Hyposmocoma kahamanoa]|uniref:odorant receptor 13a-like n=1 Tax=Hyposmocoma kahamanoa TaxID=1477025 RepID=UPI000E6D79E7|nr:odorant receptor 13a-like [Hyposmocoma kahamanoa]
MVTKFLESLEDHKQRLLGPNIWIMTSTGLLLPENNFFKVVYIIIHELVTLFVITQCVEIYVVRSDLDQVIENVKISLMSIMGVIKSNSFLFEQNRWKQVLEYVTEADEYERVHKDKIRGEIIDRYTKYCRRVTYFSFIFVFVTVVTVISTPLLNFLSSRNFREGFRNGSEPFPHICSSWTPFDKNHSPGSWITVIWHICMCAYGGSLVAAYDTSIIVIMKFFGGKLDLLRERAKLVLGPPGNRISDDEVKRMLRCLHHEHILLIKQSRLFNSLLSPVMFLYVAMCSLNLCAVAFQLTSATSATQKLFLAVFFLFVIAQIFIYCWQSNDVLVKSKQLTLGPYESEWWAANAKQMQYALMLAGQFRIQCVFTAGPFASLTLPTFITIVKGAYSYYTLLRK